jgi:hypothetical protein
MNPKEISDAVEIFYQQEKPVIVLLTDGTSFYTILSYFYKYIFQDTLHWSFFIEKVRKLVPNHLVIDCRHFRDKYTFFIPYEKVAGLTPMEYEQKSFEVPSEDNQSKSLDVPERKSSQEINDFQIEPYSALSYLNEDTWNKLSKQPFEKQKDIILCAAPIYPSIITLNRQKPVKWGQVTFNYDTPLYCDWEFLSKKNSGINNLGVGIPIASFSAGWQVSLWKSFKKKLTQKSVPIEKLETKQEAMVSGFTYLLQSRNRKFNNLEIEAGTWTPGIVVENRVSNGLELVNQSWALAYFNEDDFMVPKTLWPNFSQKIRVYGEVIPVSIELEYGKRNCFIKARAAAYIH